MSQKLAGHLLVECLVEQGITHAFGVPGESYLAVLDGFHAHREKIRFVINRQEGGAAYMADAQARVTGRPGVCFVTRGPGATNASIGVHTAFQDSTPLVLFVGDVGSDCRDREAFQELDYNTFFGPNTKGMAKRVERIDDPERIPEYVSRAFATAMNGRPGPVVVVLPEDMLTRPVSARPLPRLDPVEAWSDPGALRTLREMLLQSRQPFVIAGGGGWPPQAAQALQRFAENWKLPVANAFRFQDTFDNHHAQYAGDVGIGPSPKLAQHIQDSDLLLVIGPRLGEMTTGGYTLIQAPRPKQKLVHIHGGAEELNRVYRADLAILSTMNAAARSLEVLTAPPELPWAERTDQIHADYLANLQPQTLPGPIDMAAILAVVNRLLPADAVVTNGAGNFASWVHRFHRYHGLARGLKTQLAPTSGAMGYGVPAGIAANIVTGRTAFTIAGDGDFLMNGQELATAVQHGGKSIIVLLNNGMYGTIRMHQEREYPDRISGTDLRNPDFAAYAKAFGGFGATVEKTADFAKAFEDCMKSGKPSIIHVKVDQNAITPMTTLDAIREKSMAAPRK